VRVAVFASGDRDALIGAAERLLGQNLTLLGQRGRAYAETHHGWDRVLTQLFDVYRSILGV